MSEGNQGTERMSTTEYLALLGERPTRQQHQQRERDELVHPLMEAFQQCGWWVHHEEDSRRDVRSDNGFPDIVAIKHDNGIIVECKLDGEELRADQARWLHGLHYLTVLVPYFWVCVWHLSDYDAALGYIQHPSKVKPPGVWGG